MIFLTKITDFDKKYSVLVEAESYTEAELMSQDIMRIIASEAAKLESIIKTQFKEILLLDVTEQNKNKDLIHFKAKVLQSTITDSGKLKSIKINLVIQAQDFQEANEILKEFADGFMDDAKPFGLEETEIIDFYDANILTDSKMTLAMKTLKEANIKVSTENPFI
jgi:hypothetical protein